MMDAHLSYSISLLLSLALWWGSMRATLSGDLDLAASGLRFVPAFVLARMAVGLINHLLNGYHQDAHGRDPRKAPDRPPGTSVDQRADQFEVPGSAGRRSTDRGVPPDAPMDSATASAAISNLLSEPVQVPREDINGEPGGEDHESMPG